VPGTPVGRYRVTRLVARWRMGMVYHATHDNTGPYTLITLRLAAGRRGTVEAWVERERRLMAPLRGPHLTALRDGGLTRDEHAYIVLDTWGGRSIAAALEADGPWSDRAAVGLVGALARTASAVHHAGMILGDLRPTSVMLQAGEPGEPPRPSVLDLGLARGLAAHLESPPRPAAAFCAPERDEGSPITPAEDVYALGALAYYMLTGEPPALGSGGQMAAPPSWKRRDGRVSPYVDPVVLKALSPRPVDRYPSAQQFADSLASLAEVFSLSPAAREVLGLPETGPNAFADAPGTSPYLLHDLLAETGQQPVAQGSEGPRHIETLDDFDAIVIDDDESE